MFRSFAVRNIHLERPLALVLTELSQMSRFGVGDNLINVYDEYETEYLLKKVLVYMLEQEDTDGAKWLIEKHVFPLVNPFLVDKQWFEIGFGPKLTAHATTELNNVRIWLDFINCKDSSKWLTDYLNANRHPTYYNLPKRVPKARQLYKQSDGILSYWKSGEEEIGSDSEREEATHLDILDVHLSDEYDPSHQCSFKISWTPYNTMLKSGVL